MDNNIKVAKILFLILFLAIPSLPEDVLVLHINEENVGSAFCLECDHRKKTECVPQKNVKILGKRYECTAGATIRKKIVLKNARIELEQFIHRINQYVPEGFREREVLEKRKIGNFLKDINKMSLVTEHTIAAFCYNINIYDDEHLIATFETNGSYFYDRKNKLMYGIYGKNEVYNAEKDLLLKYWDILEEDHCR